MKKTIAYIDGFNLYYGMLQGVPSCKWLDPVVFVKSLLREDHDIVCVKFFTARIRPYPHDEQAIARQNLYLQALKAQPYIQVVEGYYNRNKIWLPHTVQKCRDCKDSRNGMARVMKFDEKRSDVNLTSALLSDAFRRKGRKGRFACRVESRAAPLDCFCSRTFCRFYMGDGEWGNVRVRQVLCRRHA